MNVKQQHFRMARRKRVLILCFTRSCGEGNGTHFSALAWKVPRTEKRGGPPSVGSQSRTRLSDHTHTHIPVFLKFFFHVHVFLYFCGRWSERSHTKVSPLIMYTRKGQAEYGGKRASPGHLTLQQSISIYLSTVGICIFYNKTINCYLINSLRTKKK